MRRPTADIRCCFLFAGENHGAHFERATIATEGGAGALEPADTKFGPGDYDGQVKGEAEEHELKKKVSNEVV